MKELIFTCILLNVFYLSAQITESFDDGNLTSNPSWTGDISSFQINTSNQLQLNESGSGTKYISTPDTCFYATEWQFYIRLNFDPSNNNNARIYLVSDQNNLNGSLNGYFVRIGENGSNDGIDLYKQSGTTETLLIDGTSGTVASKPEIKVKVIHELNGEWKLYADLNAGNSFVLQGSANDKSYTSTNHFGILCNYTTSNTTNFYFDDFYSGPIVKDSIAPSISSIEVVDPYAINVFFSEVLDSTSALSENNYTVTNGIGQPSKVKFINDESSVTCTFSTALVNKGNYTLKISNIEDLSGNKTLTDSIDFIYYKPEEEDIIFNEILADPSPSIGLPGGEFIELYNPTDIDINIDNWTVSDASTQIELPAYLLPQKGYLILCNISDTSAYKPYGEVLGVALPTLNNSGDDLTLKSAFGDIIDFISYNTEWYQDDSKEDGGWSLERINPNHPCSDESNWSASEDPSGGSPGSINSIFSDLADQNPPVLVSGSMSDSITIELYFSEAITDSSMLSQNFKTGCNNAITSITCVSEKTIRLTLTNFLTSKDTCSIFYRNIADCWGNTNTAWQYNQVQYIVPEAAEMYDIIISEIMADPDPVLKLPAFEYIELYNRSDKYISLNNWRLEDQSTSVLLPSYVIQPSGYLILCHENHASDYASFGQVAGLSSFPSLGNSEDVLSLFDIKDMVIHYVSYTDEWYEDDLKKEGGYSLEIIDPDNYCSGKSNWTASNDPNGGTPGQINSVNQANKDITQPIVAKVLVQDSVNMMVYFNERMDTVDLKTTEYYKLNSGIGYPMSTKLFPPQYDRVLLTFASALQAKKEYEFEIKNLKDCAGNVIETSQFWLGIPKDADSADIIINELLFNPYPSGYDFVELYNRSNQFIDLKNLYIAKLDDDGNISSPQIITETGYQIPENDYVVLTENIDDIESRYTVKFPEKMVEVDQLPSFNDDEGNVILLKRTGEIIDQLYYSEDYHFDLLKDLNGVSLERLNPDEATGNPANWHSAASDIGFATPGYKNSQYSEIRMEDKEIIISPKVFSPDGDGYDDLVKIIYNFDHEGYYGSITIYDIQGKEISEIENKALFGKEGFFTWDGITNDGYKAPVGVYIVLIQINHVNGTTKKFKKTCTLARKY